MPPGPAPAPAANATAPPVPSRHASPDAAQPATVNGVGGAPGPSSTAGGTAHTAPQAATPGPAAPAPTALTSGVGNGAGPLGRGPVLPPITQDRSTLPGPAATGRMLVLGPGLAKKAKRPTLPPMVYDRTTIPAESTGFARDPTIAADPWADLLKKTDDQIDGIVNSAKLQGGGWVRVPTIPSRAALLARRKKLYNSGGNVADYTTTPQTDPLKRLSSMGTYIEWYKPSNESTSSLSNNVAYGKVWYGSDNNSTYSLMPHNSKSTRSGTTWPLALVPNSNAITTAEPNLDLTLVSKYIV